MNSEKETIGRGTPRTHTKTAFRPVYLALMIYTLWSVAAALCSSVWSMAPGEDIAAAFNGRQNVDTLRAFLLFSHVSIVGYVLLVYLLLEALEEGLGPYAELNLRQQSSMVLSIFDYLGRLAIVAFVVFGPKFLEIRSYAEAWKVVFFLTSLVCCWFLVLYIQGKRLRPIQWAPISGVALISFLLMQMQANGLQTQFGLAVTFVMFLLGLFLTSWALHTLRSFIPQLARSLWNWITHWP